MIFRDLSRSRSEHICWKAFSFIFLIFILFFNSNLFLNIFEVLVRLISNSSDEKFRRGFSSSPQPTFHPTYRHNKCDGLKLMPRFIILCLHNLMKLANILFALSVEFRFCDINMMLNNIFASVICMFNLLDIQPSFDSDLCKRCWRFQIKFSSSVHSSLEKGHKVHSTCRRA